MCDAGCVGRAWGRGGGVLKKSTKKSKHRPLTALFSLLASSLLFFLPSSSSSSLRFSVFTASCQRLSVFGFVAISISIPSLGLGPTPTQGQWPVRVSRASRSPAADVSLLLYMPHTHTAGHTAHCALLTAERCAAAAPHAILYPYCSR